MYSLDRELGVRCGSGGGARGVSGDEGWGMWGSSWTDMGAARRLELARGVSSALCLPRIRQVFHRMPEVTFCVFFVFLGWPQGEATNQRAKNCTQVSDPVWCLEENSLKSSDDLWPPAHAQLGRRSGCVSAYTLHCCHFNTSIIWWMFPSRALWRLNKRTFFCTSHYKMILELLI